MKLTTILRILIMPGLVAVTLWASIIYSQQILANLDTLKTMAEAHIVIAAVIFIGIYIAATMLFFLPVSFLTLIGGWLFGPVLGVICNASGALAGAAFAFLVTRHVAADWVAHHVGARAKTVRDGVSRAGWRFVALVRLAPILPFNVLNGALGLTDIKFRDYLLATAIFMLPAKIAYTYAGSLGFTFITHPQQNNLIKLVLGGGFIIAALGLPWIITYFRKK